MSTGTIEQEVNLGIDMNKALDKMLERMDNNEPLKQFIYCLCENFKENINKDLSKNELIMLGILVGWIGNDIFKKLEKGIPSITDILEKAQGLYHYEVDLDDGNKFITVTNNENITQEELVKIVEEQIDKKVVSEFRKLSEEESKKYIEKVLEQIKKENEQENEN